MDSRDGGGRRAGEGGRITDNILDCVSYSAPKVLRIVHRLDINRQTIPESIPNFFVESCSNELAWPLSLLIRLGFQSGTYAFAHISASVVHIPKPNGHPKSVGILLGISSKEASFRVIIIL